MNGAESYFEDLLMRVIEGVATEEEFATFSEIIRIDVGLRRRYEREMRLHALLSCQGVANAVDKGVPPHAASPKRGWPKASAGGRGRSRFWLKVAAAVVLAGTVMWRVANKGGDEKSEERRADTIPSAPSPVKMVEWKGAWGLEMPQELPGRIRLAKGEAKVRLPSGVELALLGPLELESDERGMEVRLERGRLVAWVPTRASGFTVRAPGLTAWDIGTVFSVEAEADGSSLFVFKGSVQVLDGEGNGVDLCDAGEGVRAIGGRTPFKVAAEGETAERLFKTVGGYAALAEPGKAFDAVRQIGELWMAKYVPEEASRVRERAERQAALRNASQKIPITKTTWVRPSVPEKEGCDMNKTNAAAVLTAAAMAMGADNAISESVWNNPVSGDWTNSSMWADNRIPDMPDKVWITNGVASYTVAVPVDTTATFTNLTVRSDTSEKITLNLAGTMDLQDGTISLAGNTEFCIPAGGLLRMNNNGIGNNTDGVSVKDGASFILNDGDLLITNAYRRPISIGQKNHVEGEPLPTSRFEVRGGQFKRFFSVAEIGVYPGGELLFSGGQTYLYSMADTWHSWTLQPRGGLVEMSGSAEVVLKNVSSYYEQGAFNIKDSSVFRINGSLSVSPIPGKAASITVQDQAVFSAGRVEWGSGSKGGLLEVLTATTSPLGLDSAIIGQERGTCVWHHAQGYIDLHAGGLALGNNFRGVTNNACGILTMDSGGMTVGGAVWFNDTDTIATLYGLILGRKDGYSNNGFSSNTAGNCYGELNLNGGVITNTFLFFVGMGPNGTGIINQKGGAIYQKSCSSLPNLCIGWGGGYGKYHLEAGTLQLGNAYNICVGGETPDANFWMRPQWHLFTGGAYGELRMDGGEIIATRNGCGLLVGQCGTGVVTIGGQGLCKVDTMVLYSGSTNDVKSAKNYSQSSTLALEFNEGGIGKLEILGKMIIQPGAKLIVDVSRYTGKDSLVKLFSAANVEGSFREQDIIVRGSAQVRQDTQGVYWAQISHGTVISIR